MHVSGHFTWEWRECTMFTSLEHGFKLIHKKVGGRVGGVWYEWTRRDRFLSGSRLRERIGLVMYLDPTNTSKESADDANPRWSRGVTGHKPWTLRSLNQQKNNKKCDDSGGDEVILIHRNFDTFTQQAQFNPSPSLSPKLTSNFHNTVQSTKTAKETYSLHTEIPPCNRSRWVDL